MKRGSTTVEAALVFPLILIVLLGIVSLGITLSNRVKNEAEKLEIQEEIIEPGLSSEKVLRLKWMGIQVIGD